MRDARWAAVAVVLAIVLAFGAGFFLSDGDGGPTSPAAVQAPTPNVTPSTAASTTTQTTVDTSTTTPTTATTIRARSTTTESTSPIATTAAPTTTPSTTAYVPTVPPALAELTVPEGAADAAALPGQGAAIQVAENEGQHLGSIEIPKLDLVHYIYEGVQLTTLDLGPGHWPGTPLPGQDGNVVLAGHRTSMNAAFRKLDELEGGDEVLLRTNDGTFTYIVDRTEIVDPSALWIADQTDAPTATLFACHPPGSISQRIVVRLNLET